MSAGRTPKPTIDVRYSCHKCGLAKVSVSVSAREPNEDLLGWMNALGVAMSMDHDRRSPDCHPLSFSEVMIPMTGAAQVGGAAVQ